MSRVLMCDGCGKQINPAKPYYVVTGTRQHDGDDGSPVIDDPTKTVDFHDNCLPWGEKDIVPPAVEPPADNGTPEPEPTAEPKKASDDVPVGPAEPSEE